MDSSMSYWCNARTESDAEYTLFRRSFTLSASADLNLSVSADCRYNLYLDGKFLGRGPVRGDLEHYRFETYSQTLPAGNHVLAAEVLCWRDRQLVPWSEVHYAPAFYVSGSCGEIELSTPSQWRCTADRSRRSLQWEEATELKVTIPAPPMEAFAVSRAPSGWREISFDDGSWHAPRQLARPCFADRITTDPPCRWKFSSGQQPQMIAESIDGWRVLAADNAEVLCAKGALAVRFLPGRGRVLLDLGKYYTHSLVLKGEGGSGLCRIVYAETLRTEDGTKTVRNPFPGGRIGPYGYGDQIELADAPFEFRPFWYRSGRYVELQLDTAHVFKIHSLRFSFVHFPLELRVAPPDDPMQRRIFDTAWHTALCCAHEHYEDCPYYEQMQYVGDTRIQALISYIGAGERRLGRQAIRQFDHSRLASGLTMSRYPTNFRQIIPQFSLFWVLMIEDYHRFFPEDAIVREHWNGICDVMNYMENRSEASGLIGPVGNWNFSDWADEWPMGKSDRGENLPETLLNLIYADCCRAVAAFAGELGMPAAADYTTRGRRVLAAVNRYCFDTASGLYTDVPGKPYYSQHTNIWAILAGAAAPERRNVLADAIMHDEKLSQCTLYFSFYLLEMLRRLDRYDDFCIMLKRWNRFLDNGFTTFPECPSLDTRSDCHAWSAGPFYQMLRFREQRQAGAGKSENKKMARRPTICMEMR